jgi:rhodanese-related sulfurtransferase
VADAKALLDAGTAIFIDVRGPADYELGHLPGAILMPLPDVETRASELPRGAAIITYCT